MGVAGDDSELWQRRVKDYSRHVADLRHRTYEGASDRKAKEETFLRAFELTTPLALRVLEDLSNWYLAGTGSTQTNLPSPDGRDGLVGSWAASWPLLEQDRDRTTGRELPPVAICVVFPIDWTHPHLALMGGGVPAFAWPFQVASPEDVARQEPVLRVMAEAELHDRIYCARSNWAVLPEGFGANLG
ncbi:MAG TPA: hypothetical protein VMS00_12830 [Acidimicrobiales bacterium]|nr:hypothetical protein [Acidimicrobiales bacterium]